MNWVKENSAVIHFCGRRKPWKKPYIGSFGVFYDEAENAYLKNK